MATDRTEQSRRGQSAPKTTTKHPYAAIEHRVIDSPAFADLKPTAQALLLLMARQLTKDNNGHLQASFKWCSQFGIGSEHTLRSSIADLISHGFIYRTRSHGANGAWARYAVTWLPIKNREGLFLAGFAPCAWRDWQPTEKKTTPQKLLDQSGRKCSFTLKHPAESAGTRGAKTAAYELMPCSSAQTARKKAVHDAAPRIAPGAWLSPYLNRLTARGLANACPVALVH